MIMDGQENGLTIIGIVAMNSKWMKTIIWNGVAKTIECKKHSYAWSGKIPCTGIYRCVYCGKPENGRTYHGKNFG